MSALAILETAGLNRECVSCGGHNELIFCHDCSESRCDNCSILWHKHPKRLSHNIQVYLVSYISSGALAISINLNAKQKHLRCKKGEANQKQQLSDYKSIHSYTCD